MADSGFSLSQQMRQQQRLTPMQVQYVRMLEMTAPELEDEVRRALDEMPALEVAPENNPSDDNPGSSMQDKTSGSDAGYEVKPWSGRYTTDIIQATAEDESPTLLEYLYNQLEQLNLNPEALAVAKYVAGSLDSNGYLTRTPEAIADDMAINEGIEVTPEEVGRAIETVQFLEPAGIGAASLRESLALQLRRLPRSTETLTALEIIEKHFDTFAKRHFDRLASAMGIDRANLDDAVAQIMRLNPKPGGGFASGDDRRQHIIPDFVVEPSGNGSLTLTMPSNIPRLQVEASFEAETPLPDASEKRTDDARRFLKIKRDDARNFISVLSMRRETLFKVMSAILKLQHRFFITENDEEIRPMVLRDIAALTGLNLSMVSRATRDKYVATPHAIYSLKKFFNERVRTDDDTVTANRITTAIRQAVETEDPEAPLSDRELTDLLAAKGFPIARRTVAKYRESLSIPVARLRKNH